MNEQSGQDGMAGFAFGLVIGGIIGLVVGTLLAPRSGQDTRSQLAYQSERLRRRLLELRDESQPPA